MAIKQEKHFVRKSFIEDCVKQYKRAYPEEFAEHTLQVKKIRESRANEYASDVAKEIRWGLSVPKKLMDQIDQFIDNPRFLEEEEEFKWFSKKFKTFVIPQKL